MCEGDMCGGEMCGEICVKGVEPLAIHIIEYLLGVVTCPHSCTPCPSAGWVRGRNAPLHISRWSCCTRTSNTTNVY